MQFLLFGEVLDVATYIGVIFLIFGAFLLNYKKTTNSKLFKRSFIYIILSTISYAVGIVALHYVEDQLSFEKTTGWLFLMMGISALPLIIKLKNYFVLKKNNFKNILKWAAIGELLSIGGYVFLALALKIKTPSLVYSTLSVQSFFVLIMSLLISFKFPNFINEFDGKKKFLIKFFAIALMFFGALLLNI
jgi:drug/metabolite transporter (DMT)-like permease